jgi:hypothetical protein
MTRFLKAPVELKLKLGFGNDKSNQKDWKVIKFKSRRKKTDEN